MRSARCGRTVPDVQWRGFADHLTLLPAGPDRLVGQCLPGMGSRAFGGHVAALSVMAAGQLSADDRVVRSVHTQFLP